VVTTGAIGRAKLQSNRHHQQTNILFFLQAGCPSCHLTNSVKALNGVYLVLQKLYVMLQKLNTNMCLIAKTFND